ncbi:MAG: glycosyltransferase family 2 protein [Phormidesmis sp.]
MHENKVKSQIVCELDKLESPKVSIIICNYNYANFVEEAITSAIDQDYENIEIIVVDDGSTDSSKEVLSKYACNPKVSVLFKSNGGQASAFNAGYALSSGDVISFLDSDDRLHQKEISHLLDEFGLINRLNEKLLIGHRLSAIDEYGESKGFLINIPASSVCVPPGEEGESFQQYMQLHLKKYKFIGYPSAPTSGLVMTRVLGQIIFPLPEKGIVTSADDFIVVCAALLGETYFSEQVLGYYRIHSENAWYANQNKPKSKYFIDTLDTFLNKRLCENGFQLRASYFDSWYARDFYLFHSKPLQLIRLAFQVPLNHLSVPTLRFFLKTLVISITLLSKRVLSFLFRYNDLLEQSEIEDC